MDQAVWGGEIKDRKGAISTKSAYTDRHQQGRGDRAISFAPERGTVTVRSETKLFRLSLLASSCRVALDLL